MILEIVTEGHTLIFVDFFIVFHLKPQLGKDAGGAYK